MRKTTACLAGALALAMMGGGDRSAGKVIEQHARTPQQEAVMVAPAGTVLHLRLDEALDTSRNFAGDHFAASLSQPVILHGETVIPRGTTFRGHVVDAKPSGRLRGRGQLGIKLDSFVLDGRWRRIAVAERSWTTGNHKKRNLLLIGGGSGTGALIGGLAAGGPWALAAAGIGAGAGTAGAALTGKKNVHLPAETRLTFVLRAPVTVRRPE
jgi:transcriptional antiterminator Rof (Rho-off)